ncbi:uncharacterized protein LOC112563094 isoform X2 [Pomacea canaliculata]|uniref:uncharacterized protein LOC112563094 isoform X2 n=1 Tax=Pomacea canaliculata TaxID=400727 RepID=UPI000D72C721|nr:uncharacterized protein LOC112563094 isoform X2 [Pomacea canaliculata]
MTNISESSASKLTQTEIALLIVAVIGITILFLIIMFCFCREHIIRICPSLFKKNIHKSRTGQHFVDRFGDTKIKFATCSLSELRASKSLPDSQESTAHNGGCQTVSVDIPVFEEKLSAMLKDKQKPENNSNNVVPKKTTLTKKATSPTQQAPASISEEKANAVMLENPASISPSYFKLHPQDKTSVARASTSTPHEVSVVTLRYDNPAFPSADKSYFNLQPSSPSIMKNMLNMIDSDDGMSQTNV